jgi:signal transduction histidine kinase
VVIVALAAVMLTNSFVTAREVDTYVTRAGGAWARQLVPLLAREYARTGSWVSAEQILSGPSIPIDDTSSQTLGPNARRGMMGRIDNFGGMWGMMGFRLLLLDSSGSVIVDTQDELEGDVLSGDILAEGTPIIVEQQRVGTLLVTNDNPLHSSSLRATLIPSINRVVVPAALAAVLTALLMGTLLFRLITRPLSDLERAAQAVSKGDLAVRVPETTTDELGMLAKSFNQMTTQLGRQEQLRKQMVGDIAHELRTPLSVMQGTLEAMLDGVLKPNASELRNLHSETRRLTRLVEDLRTLSLADEGQLKLELEPVEAGELIEQVVRQTSMMADTLHITLHTEIDETLPPITADSDRLIQVLTNLLGNALRYASENGHITVRATRSGNAVRLAVQDDGPGIAPENLPFVFERFWRSDKSRSRGSGGSGIGLAIVKQLIEMHGGTVGVESEVGKGATFWIELPVSEADGV